MMKSGSRSLLVIAMLLLGSAAQPESAWSAQNASARRARVIKKWETFERREFPEQATLRGHHEADDRLSRFFMANVNRLDRRRRFEMEALLLHETVRGHHLQIARATEIDALPEFRRHLWITAYGEGWAVYAESLGEQMKNEAPGRPTVSSGA